MNYIIYIPAAYGIMVSKTRRSSQNNAEYWAEQRHPINVHLGFRRFPQILTAILWVNVHLNLKNTYMKLSDLL